MDQITEATCKIQSVIMHIVDNRTPNLSLVDEPLVLSPAIADFLRKHIVRSIAQSSIAVFNLRSTNEVSLSCERVFEKPAALVKESKALATRLFGFMKPKTINPGTFWTTAFSEEGNPVSYLALMKMDDIATFTYKTTDKDGRNVIDLEQYAHTLPNVRMKLDKAAFIVPADAEGFDYELRVLDKKLPEEAVATYFTDFLSFHAPQTDLEKTRIFMTGVESWIKEHHTELPKAMTEMQLRDLKRSYLDSHAAVRPREFAAAAFGKKYRKLSTSLLAHLHDQGLKDPRFTVHQSEWTKRSSKVTYRLQSGEAENLRTVEIKGDLDAIKTMVKIIEPTKTDPHYYASITADKFEMVP